MQLAAKGEMAKNIEIAKLSNLGVYPTNEPNASNEKVENTSDH